VIARLTRFGLERGSHEDVQAAAVTLARPAVLLRGFLAADLLEDIQRRLATATFSPRIETGFTVGRAPRDEILADDGISGRIRFLFNDPALFDLVRALSGCDRIGFFRPTVFRMLASRGHFDEWHGDVDGNRMVALSVNLTSRPFEGGILQIRNADDHRVIFELANTGAGDAVLFLVSPRLQHKVSDIAGTEPRVVLAGWFQREPRYGSIVSRTPVRTAG
jgi:hypothetical protein